jgi:hypothetical protein
MRAFEPAAFIPEGDDLVWITGTTQDRDCDGNAEGPRYEIWFLVERATDRMLGNIDAPKFGRLCWQVCGEGGLDRLYISLDGARAAMAKFMRALLRREAINAAEDAIMDRVEKNVMEAIKSEAPPE